MPDPTRAVPSRWRGRSNLRQASSTMGEWGNDFTVRRGEALRALSALPMLYAVQYGDRTIKIGCTSNLYRRLHHLGANGAAHGHGYEINLLAIKPGDFADEGKVHASLTSSLSHGAEWYQPTSEVAKLVNSWRSDLGLAPATL